MRKCRIEVIKVSCNEELANEYGKKGVTYCGAHKLGDVFISDGSRPEGLCGDAWTCVKQYVEKLVEGDVNFYGGEWVNRENLAIAGCNDGLTPVVFKVEGIEA